MSRGDQIHYLIVSNGRTGLNLLQGSEIIAVFERSSLSGVPARIIKPGPPLDQSSRTIPKPTRVSSVARIIACR